MKNETDHILRDLGLILRVCFQKTALDWTLTKYSGVVYD